MQQTTDNSVQSLIEFADNRSVTGEESDAVGGSTDVGDGCHATDAIPTWNIFNLVKTDEAVNQQQDDRSGSSSQNTIIADIEAVPGQSCLEASVIATSTTATTSTPDRAYVYDPQRW